MEPAGQAGMKPCPFCREPVPSGSAVCRWCGEALAPSPGAPASMPSSLPALKPMTVIEILNAAFRIYRNNFLLFLGIIAIAYVPLVLIMTVWPAMLRSVIPQTATGFEAAAADPLIEALQRSPGAPVQPDASKIGFLCGAIFAIMAIYLIAVPIAEGALTRAISDRYLGRRATFSSSYGAVLRMFFSFLMTTFLAGLLIGGGLFLCIIPGIFMFVMLRPVTQVLIVERIRGTDALGRAMKLTAGHRWRILGLAVLGLLVSWLMSVALSVWIQIGALLLIKSQVTQEAISNAGNQFVQMLLQPIWSVAWVLLYYDIRIRKEAFDLDLLSQRAG